MFKMPVVFSVSEVGMVKATPASHLSQVAFVAMKEFGFFFFLIYCLGATFCTAAAFCTQSCAGLGTCKGESDFLWCGGGVWFRG